MAERITKKCIFEEMDEKHGKLSPIKKAISHEVKEITNGHKGLNNFFKDNMRGRDIP